MLYHHLNSTRYVLFAGKGNLRAWFNSQFHGAVYESVCADL